MTITPRIGSCRIPASNIMSDRALMKRDHTSEVTTKQQIEVATSIILKKDEESTTKPNRKYTVPKNTPHPYITQYTRYKNASDDEEKIQLLSSFSKEAQLYIVVKIPEAIQHTPPFVRENVEFVLSAVRQNGLILEYLTDTFKNDPQIVSIAFYQNPRSLRYAFCTSTILHQNGRALRYASNVVQDDLHSVLIAINQDRAAFFYASERLRKDQKIIDAASESSIRSMQDIPENMREDKETLLKLLRENGLEFEHIPEKYKTDHDIVLTALRQNYRVFEYLSHDLQNDDLVISFAIWQDDSLFKYLNKENVTPYIVMNGLLIQHVADSLKKDKSLAILALQQNKEAFRYIDSSLQSDPEIEAIYLQPDIDFPNASIEIRSNKIAALAAVKRNGLFIKYVDSTIQDDSMIFLSALRQNSMAFQYLQRARILRILNKKGDRLKYAGALRGDLEVVETAVSQNGLAFKFALPPASDQEFIIFQALLQNSRAFHSLPDNLKNNQKFVVKCLKLEPSIILFVPDKMWVDREFILAAVKENGMVLQYLQDDRWIEDDEIVYEAIKQNRWAIEFAPDHIRRDRKYRKKIKKKKFVKYDKQIILDLTCKTTAIALAQKVGAVAGKVPTKIVPIVAQDSLGQMIFSESLSYKSRIYLIGHSAPGQGFFSSDNNLIITVEAVTTVIKNFFINKTMQNGQKVRVSLVGCYSGTSFGTNKSFAEKLSISLDQASIPAEVIGRRSEVVRAEVSHIDQYKKIVGNVHQEPGMTVVFSTENGKTTMQHRYLDGLSISKDVIEFPNFGTLFKNLSYYEIDLLVDGQDKILKKVQSTFQAHLNHATGGVGQWFFGKHPKIKNQKTIWFINLLGSIDYARADYDEYLQDDKTGVGDFDVYVLAHYLKKNQLKPENAIVQSKNYNLKSCKKESL